jgi:hypothetical protein
MRIISAPASASAIATDCPMPLVPPVTSAVCPCRENMSIVTFEAMINLPRFQKSRKFSSYTFIFRAHDDVGKLPRGCEFPSWENCLLGNPDPRLPSNAVGPHCLDSASDGECGAFLCCFGRASDLGIIRSSYITSLSTVYLSSTIPNKFCVLITGVLVYGRERCRILQLKRLYYMVLRI